MKLVNRHWRKGVVLGETLKELGFLHEEDLQKILNIQKASLSYPAL